MPTPHQPPFQIPPSDAAFAHVGLEYVGTPYVYTGANPQRGWDCSGMWNWIFSQRFGMTLPGGIRNFNGSWHGPVVVSYAAWTQAVTVPIPDVGDLCLWVGIGPSGHMGVCTKGGLGGEMVSALNPSLGTRVTPIQGSGPSGAPLIYRRITGVHTPVTAGCLPQVAGTGMIIGGIAAWMMHRSRP